MRRSTARLPDDDDAADAGPRDAAAASERTCIVTRTKGSPDDMIRFVVGPDDHVVPDIRRKLPGRGVWVTAEVAHVTTAVARQLFSRGFRRKVQAAADLPALVDALLVRDCVQALAMANKAGAVAAGFGKVDGAVNAGPLAALLHAREAGADGVRKLGQALRRVGGGASTTPQMKLFSSAELDLALGGTNVIHAALAVGPASTAFLKRCRRLSSYRPAAPLALNSDLPGPPDAASEQTAAAGLSLNGLGPGTQNE